MKNGGLSFCWFRRLPLRGTLNFSRKISPKSQQRIVGGWKQFMNFCKKWRILAILAAYQLRGYFYRRTNLTISIRYISEKNSQEGKSTASCQDGTKRNREWYGSNWPISKRKKRWANARIAVWTKCPCGAPPYIVRMHTAQDHAVNLHGRRLNIVCGTVEGKNEG